MLNVACSMFLEKKSEAMIEMSYPLMDTELYRRKSWQVEDLESPF